MSLTQQLQQQWQQSRQQIAANPRLAWGLWCIGLLALFYANLLLSDQRTLLRSDLNSLYLQQQDAVDLSKNADWSQRLSQAEQALKQQASRFGQAESAALARAEVQAALGRQLKQHHIERGRVEVSAAPAVNADTGLVALQVQLTGQAKGDQLLTLLAEIEQGQPYYRVDSLTTTRSPRSQHLNLTLLATVWYLSVESSE